MESGEVMILDIKCRINDLDEDAVLDSDYVQKLPITLLFGTSNEAKLSTMRKHLTGLNINIIGLNDIDIKLPDIDESGSNPLDNAKIKA